VGTGLPTRTRDGPVDVPPSWPSGMVTFVLTDIEGSTRLLKRLADGYGEVIDRHDDLLRRMWLSHGGAHVSARGDSHLAAFGDARSALEACAEAQRELAGAPWPAGSRPKVRMGVHTGLASPRGGDYVALAVHQAARVSAAAHGDQVLASDVTARAAGDLPGLHLDPVGRYRLRDFDEAVQLFGLRGSGLESDFPAVRAMPVDGHNLAVPATSFVGRDGDVADLLGLTGPGRVVTLTGPGGVGKTRLAVAAGLASVPRWESGVWFVDLAPVQDAHLIGTALAAAVGASTGQGMEGWAAAVDHLRTRAALVLLDNCEHLAAPVAERVAELLATCPDVGVLATSREPLGITQETVWRVRPLAVPGFTDTVAEVVEAPSVRLFVDRARAARRDFTVDPGNARTVSRLCARLDGLPLALELAAARTSVMTVGELLEGVDAGLRSLQSRRRGVPDRQRTIDAVVRWSYELLDRDEQALLRRLSVFRDGFSRDAAVAAGGDLAGVDAAELLWSLVDKSLVIVDVTANDTRYRLLETVNAWVNRLLREEGVAERTATRLARWWLDRIGPWRQLTRTRSGEIATELDNLRALIPLIAQEAEHEAQVLVCSIGHHYYAIDAPRDGTADLARLAAELDTPSQARVSLLATLALLLVHHGDLDDARQVLGEAQRVQQIVGGPPPWDEVAVERASGELAIRTGDYAGASELAAAALRRDLGPRARVRMHNLLAIASYYLGDTDRAYEASQGELEMANQLGDEHLMAVAEGNVAELALRRGDRVAAARHQEACLDLGLALGRPLSVAISLIVAARLTASTDAARALRLHAKAEGLLAESAHRLYEDDRRASDDMLARIRADLGASMYVEQRAAGESLSLSDAASSARAALQGVEE
jgi:predicted ATPase/class 3 adenylate cyclase